MASYLVISNMQTGYETDREPFIINNDAFPILNNAYIWRGRVPRKRGTKLLGRLEIELVSQNLGNTTGGGTFSGNIFSIIGGILTIAPNATIAPGSITIVVGANTLTEPATPNGTLVGAPAGSGTINYQTGALTLTGLAAVTAVIISFGYYPDLPVMGLRDFEIGLINQPIMVSFDTRYSYEFNQGTNIFYNVNFYKTTGIPFTWSGHDYQQFYTTNYLGVNTIADSPDKTGCMWATNGNPGFNFVNGTYTSGSGTANITFNFKSGGVNFTTLIVGDILWFNEWGTGSSTINGLNGTVSDATGAAAGNYIVTFSGNQTVAGTGIAQLMTNTVPGQDGIRWYDGDPTVSSNFGWVNFAPPLNQFSASNLHPPYLVGADVITPFKNRLIFSGVYIRTSATSPGVQYYPNRIVYSQVGSPYYSSPLPFPIMDQPPDPAAWYQNVAGRGGFLTAPVDQEIIDANPNGDVLIYGMETSQLKLLYTFDDSLPFIFQTINTELGSQNTFSSVVLDEGVLSIGDYGIIMTNQKSAQRIDLQIPDQVFDISVLNNNNYRVTAVRDYRYEWIYFTYCSSQKNTANNLFPDKTLLYNYRDNNWATFDETFTAYGTFRRTTNTTWASLNYLTWAEWNAPWNFGSNDAFFPNIVGGNAQGFVLEKGSDEGTQEANSQYISAINTTTDTITSPNHCLDPESFITISGVIGVSNINGNIYQVIIVDADNFKIFPINPLLPPTGTYEGGGVYNRLSRPTIQTKQFPIYWKDGLGCRAGMSRYLFDTTADGAITLNIYSNLNSDEAANDPAINPYLIYSDVINTQPEPSLYGANPAYASGSAQNWHRLSNSFVGNAVQFEVTLSDAQMRDPNSNQAEIVLQSIVLDLYPGPMLAN